MDDDQQFCLRWNNHQSTLVAVFDTLLEKGMHVDCTLAAEGQTLKAHKVVLSACSPYFESVLSQQYDKHPIIILKDVKYAELRAMMDYMYRGEVNISQDQLAALLKAAESLQIKGLSDNKPSRPPSRPAHPPHPSHPPHATPHPPRAPSPPPMAREGSDDSRSGSMSPSRRRKKARRASLAGVGGGGGEEAPEPANGEEPLCKKEEPPRLGVEDLTLDEDHDDHQPVSHNDVVRNFQWHMERSQDEIMNSSDSVRDSQELHKDALPSALLSLLSMQAQQRAMLAPGGVGGAPIPLFPNNNTVGPVSLSVEYKQMHAAGKQEEDSDGEYDDTDDIVLPEETDTYYEPGSFPGTGGGAHPAHAHTHSNDSFEGEKGAYKRDGSGSDDPSRQFECRHCGKKYRWKSTLRRHENVECGGKAPAHQCPYCSYKAKQRGNLGVHIRKHHNDEWYIYATNKVRRNKKTSI